MATAQKRLPKELDEVNKADLGASVAFKDDNMFLWEGVLIGPSGTPYADGAFEFQLQFPSGADGYPFKAPTFQFFTKVYHPNVSEKGLMCIPRIEGASWAASCTPAIIIQDVVQLFKEPDVSKATNPEAGDLYISNKPEFINKATQYTKQYAM